MKHLSEAHRYLLPALLVALLSGCGADLTAPVVPESPEEPAEPAPPSYVYAVDVETRYIDIRGSCDTDIFGDAVPGEFQFYIRLSGPGGPRTAHISRGYNTWDGYMYQRNNGTNINFGNRNYGWENLPTAGGVKIELRLAEWDGVSKDSRMRDRAATVDVPFKLGTETRRLTLGATGACQGSLYYDVTWTRTEVGS